MRFVKDDKRRTMLNTGSQCLGEDSSEDNLNRGNGELHDFDS